MTSNGPAIVVHLEDPPSSGRRVCDGRIDPATDATQWPDVPRLLCPACRRAQDSGAQP